MPLQNKKVAILGRPNVGKSTLFNILTDSRKAVVKNQPGVTRDIQIETIDIWGRTVDILDTGGLTEARDDFSPLIREQVLKLLKTIDLLLVVMDGRAGLCPEDRDVIRIAKETGRPILIVVNKLDKINSEETMLAEFFEFGEETIAASLEQRRGVAEILEWLHSRIPEMQKLNEEEFTLTIVGKPNVGKSSLCNLLLGEDRLLVSDVAGTTVDAIDVPIQINGQKYTLVDTAGLRRKSRRTEDVEIISAFKSQDAMDRAHIVLLMIDGTQGPSDQDAKILEKILDKHKGVIIVVNKSDLGQQQISDYRKVIREKLSQEFHFFADLPMTFISAKEKTGIPQLFDLINEVREKLSMKISTHELNDFFLEVIRKAPSPVYATQNVKFYYITQTGQVPPCFIAFANFPEGVTKSYRRFIANQLAEKFNLKGIPLRIFIFKSRGKNE